MYGFGGIPNMPFNEKQNTLHFFPLTGSSENTCGLFVKGMIDIYDYAI